MLTSGSPAPSATRPGVWGVLLAAGAAWLAVSWCVLRLSPADPVPASAGVVLFGAGCEGVRALAGMRTWWLNAGLAVLFAACGGLLLLGGDAGYATPVALVAWYLMVRGAVDVSVSVMNRGTDRTWGLLLSLGVVQAGLGFYGASPLSRSADPLVLTLGALALVRAIADLTTALRLREVAHAHHDVLALPPEREAAVEGYGAGLADFPARHRAQDFHDEVVRTTADLDARIAEAGVTGTGRDRVPGDLPPAPDSPAEVVDEETVR